METSTELTDIYDRLRTWARGSLPCMAAVFFLAQCDTLYEGHPMICDDGERAWPDVFELEPGVWADRTGHMSSGERATWELVRSILDGELNEYYWRLDGSRKRALITALQAYGV